LNSRPDECGAAYTRRDFLAAAGAAVPLLALHGRGFDVAAFDRARVLKAARRYLSEQPVTVTAARSPRSAGGPHDFFSEGDYWWPDPQNPSGPYVQHLSVFDYVAVSGSLAERRVEFVDHLHEHFLHPVRISRGHYVVPDAPGYGIEMRPESLRRYEFPNGKAWKGAANE